MSLRLLKRINGFIVYLKLFREIPKISDKFILFKYLLRSPLHLFNKNHSFLLSSPIVIKSKFGTFKTNKDIFSVVMLSSQQDERLLSFFKLKGTYVDVGANIGKYVIFCGKKYPNQNVIAIEMEKNNLKTLNENILLNNLENVKVISTGCFSKKTKMYIDLDTKGTGAHKLSTKKTQEGFVEVDTLDNMLKELKIKDVELIKIDTEGAEYDVLKGAKNTIKNNHPTIIFEVLNPEEFVKIKNLLGPKYSFNKIDCRNYSAIPTKNNLVN